VIQQIALEMSTGGEEGKRRRIEGKSGLCERIIDKGKAERLDRELLDNCEPC
jgi:hypothetical protein